METEVGALARIGGRNPWIAVPAGILCAAVVGALAWLSFPMVPVAVGWAGDALRTGTAVQLAEASDRRPIGADAVDCRDLYPDGLWMRLSWRGQALLDQDASPSPTTARVVTHTLAPEVLLTCSWRYDDARVVTTLASVGADAASVAASGFAAAGFSCGETAGVLTCVRVRGAVQEEHTVGRGLWLASVETGWHPEGYGAELAEHVLG